MNRDLEQIVHRLSAAQSLLVVTHARPDGDAIGSMLALARAARLAGKAALTLVPDKVPARYEFLLAGENVAGPQDFERLAGQVQLVVVVDTSVAQQLDGIHQGLAACRDRVLVIDHHATAGAIGAAQWIDSTASAAGVQVAELIERLGWPSDPSIAVALAAAVLSDTGWLKYSSTDGRTLRIVAGLFDAGVKPDELFMQLFQCDRPQRVLLMTRMLQSLRLDSDGRIASMVIRKEDFQATGALSEETENLVNEALRACTVEVAVLLVETDSVVRASLRSRRVVDVSAVAAGFGGGGHARAAGLRMAVPIDELRQKLIDACVKALP